MLKEREKHFRKEITKVMRHTLVFPTLGNAQQESTLYNESALKFDVYCNVHYLDN